MESLEMTNENVIHIKNIEYPFPCDISMLVVN